MDGTYRTYIEPKLIQHALKRGAVLAGISGALLLVGGWFLPPTDFGSVFLALFLLLLAVGWLPYRRLTTLRDQPSELLVADDELVYARKGKPVLRIPYRVIHKVHYLSGTRIYGLGFCLHGDVIVCDRNFRPTGLRSPKQCDLFLPYFKPEVARSLDARLQNVVHLD